MDGARRVLYRLPEVIKAIKENRLVCVVEGERDADALNKIGIAATTNPGGAGKWLPLYSAALRGAKVVILGDKDDAGRSHVCSVAAALHGTAAEVRVIDLAKHWPDCPPKGDISDWLMSGGGSKAALQRIVRETTVWVPAFNVCAAGADRSVARVERPLPHSRCSRGRSFPAGRARLALGGSGNCHPRPRAMPHCDLWPNRACRGDAGCTGARRY
jgi:hypothetical protein